MLLRKNALFIVCTAYLIKLIKLFPRFDRTPLKNMLFLFFHRNIFREKVGKRKVDVMTSSFRYTDLETSEIHFRFK